MHVISKNCSCQDCSDFNSMLAFTEANEAIETANVVTPTLYCQDCGVIPTLSAKHPYCAACSDDLARDIMLALDAQEELEAMEAIHFDILVGEGRY